MRIEFKGQVIGFLKEASGTGKTGKRWIRGGIVVSVPYGQDVTSIAVEAWNQTWEYCKNLHLGDSVKVDAFLESHPWQDKWFTKVSIAKLNVISTQSVKKDDSMGYDEIPNPLSDLDNPADDLPF